MNINQPKYPYKTICYDEGPFIHKVINELKWGGKESILQHGIEVLPDYGDPVENERWDLIKDPYLIISMTSYIRNIKTKEIVVINIRK